MNLKFEYQLRKMKSVIMLEMNVVLGVKKYASVEEVTQAYEKLTSTS